MYFAEMLSSNFLCQFICLLIYRERVLKAQTWGKWNEGARMALMMNAQRDQSVHQCVAKV